MVIISFQLLETCPDIVDPVEIQPTIHGTLEVSSHPDLPIGIKSPPARTALPEWDPLWSGWWFALVLHVGCRHGGFPAGHQTWAPAAPRTVWGLKMGYTMAAYRYNYPQLWPFKWRTWWNIMINKNKPAKFWGTYFQTNPNVFSWPEIDRTIRTQIRPELVAAAEHCHAKTTQNVDTKKSQTYNDKQWCTYQHSQRGAEWIISLRGHEWTPLRTHVAKKFQRAQIRMSAFQYAIQGTQKPSITILVVAKLEERNMFRSERHAMTRTWSMGQNLTSKGCWMVTPVNTTRHTHWQFSISSLGAA